jgi:hypothetical protein
MHGGRIDCEEAPEQGSVFRVYLPRANVSAPMSNALRVEIPREASR